MTNYWQLSKFVNITLLGCVMTVSLLGCQPTTDKAAPTVADTSNTDHDMPSEQEHLEAMEGHTEHEEHAGHDHSGHDHASNMDMQFDCQPEAAIGVSYHDESTPATAYLLIDGIEYDLAATADSQTYASDIGLDNTSGIIWQVTDDRAILSRKTLDSQVAVADEEVLYSCQQASAH